MRTYNTRLPPVRAVAAPRPTIPGTQPRLDVAPRPLLLVVEGVRDAEFLRSISALIHAEIPGITPLQLLERQHKLVILPFGGGHVTEWVDRLEPIGCREFHIYDREVPPETRIREQAVRRMNFRPRCHAVLMQRRSLENYLHPDAIFAARRLRVEFGPMDFVPEVVARHSYQRHGGPLRWASLAVRSRRRMIARAKQWLNTDAADHMTVSLLAAADPRGDVMTWLSTITCMAQPR